MSYKTAKMNLQPQAMAGRRSWIYDDTGGIAANAVAAGWFSDAKDKGAKVGDLVDVSVSGSVRYAATISDIQAEDTGTAKGAGTLILDTD
jgi:hypothetical protein